MLAARAMYERLLTTEQEKWLVNYYLAYCDYRLYIYEMQMENSKEAKAYINDGIDKLNRVLEENENFGEAYALMASFYGGKISLFPLSGMWNGPKSGKFMAEAYNYSSSSPRVHLLDGISKFYTPEKWGGGIAAATLSIEKAIELYGEQEADAIPAWGKTDAYTWMGNIESKKGNKAAARKYYKKALAIEPENGWVKAVLLPELDK
jgi:tetratricopeptide (TPR) repeat protein